MPQKKSNEPTQDAMECILRIGKNNNVVQWKEEMQTSVTALYGLTGMFFTTNERYVQPFPQEEDYIPDFPESEDEAVPEPDEVDAEGEPLGAVELAAQAIAHEAAIAASNARREAKRRAKEKLIVKLREGAYEGRRKAMETQKSNERTVWPMMWKRMSLASQSRVKEEEDYEEAYLALDCVTLWELIRRTHLTHIFGDGDPMREVNILEQETRFAALRQGEREYISTFKSRFDNQTKANEGAGVPEITESKLALEFIMKLDTKRYKRMLAQMRNDALRKDPDAYPKTLASAYRIASGWSNEDPGVGGHGIDNHAAFLADTAFVTKSKDPEKGGRAAGSKGKKPNEITCFVCGFVGHYARDCEKKKGGDKALITEAVDQCDKDEDIDEWDIAMVAGTERAFFAKDEILLDNEASISIFSNENLLTGVKDADKKVMLGGIQRGATGVKVTKQGIFRDVGTVYFNPAASANILSFASQIDAGADITYDKYGDKFVMTPASGENTYHFGRKEAPGSAGKFYTCDIRTMITPRETALVQTVEENLKMFTKREVMQARKAREMLARMGFPSVGQAIRTSNSGSNFEITARDFEVADAIWGKDVASMKGKTKKQASPIPDITVSPTMVQKEQVLSVDIMFVKKLAILVGVCTPLDLTLATSLTTIDMLKPSRAAEAVRKGINYFLGVMRSQGFNARLIMTDGEGAIAKLKTELNMLGVEVDVSRAGGHVARVERRIQVIKERMRTHMHHLPFALSLLCLSLLALYCVSRLNYEPSSTREWGASARELFLGRKADARRDFRCAYGDYVQSTVPETSNDMRARTEDCVVMLPTGNRTGSVKMLSLATGKIVTRDQFKILPMSTSVILALNRMAAIDGISPSHTAGPLTASIRDQDHIASLPTYFIPPIHTDEAQSDTPREQPLGALELADEVGLAPPRYDLDDNDTGGIGEMGGVPLHPNDSDDSGHLPVPRNTDTNTPSNESDEIRGDDIRGVEDEPHPAGHDSGDSGRDSSSEFGGELARGDNIGSREDEQRHRIPAGARVLDFFRRGGTDLALMSKEVMRSVRCTNSEERVMNITVREAIRTRGEEAERVIMKELGQMINKKVWTPIDGKKLTAEERRGIIRSSMFLKEKYLASGEFEKLKARLVAGGDQQDKDMYDDLSAPTVSTSSVFTILTIAAHEGRKAAVVDIGGAFLNAEMKTGVPVHMRLDRAMSDLIIRLQPSYRKFQDEKGCIVVLLNRALYGCVESAALWYDNLRETMTSLGYDRNPHDVCVFNRISETGVQCTATVHVDDLLITSVDMSMIESLSEGLRARYGEITKTTGTVLNYLGMVLDLSRAGEARVSMKGFVEDMLQTSGVTGGARTPATEGLFEVRADAPLCSETRRKEFHSQVAKLLYLAKKCRPECLTAVAFLATRVTRCTEDDWEKLTRLLRYVNGTKERGIVLRAGKDGIIVRVYIDAAYGVHADGKSHTGSCIVVGGTGAVHCKSGKQQIVTKSSTEAELVALSDSTSQGLHTRSFVMAQGYKCGPMTVYQDNMSTMALVERGRSAAERTRHIDIRYFWVKERVMNGEMIIRHLGTKEMYANLLTKPLQGAQFIAERDALTGWF